LFDHVPIDHQPLTTLEQWKASRHRLLWVAVVNRDRDQMERSCLKGISFLGGFGTSNNLCWYIYWGSIREIRKIKQNTKLLRLGFWSEEVWFSTPIKTCTLTELIG